MAHYQPEGDGSPVQSTQPFSDRDESYQARLATAVGFHERSTQAFDIKDPAYRARLRPPLAASQSPILILCLDQKKYIDRQKIEAQGTN